MTRTSLQRSRHSADVRRTPEQERFAFLIREIEKVRAEHAAVDVSLTKYRATYSERMQPLRAALTSICRQTVFALDGLLEQKGWSRPEAAALKNVLCGNAQMLLEANASDVEMRALFDKHSEVDFAQLEQDRLDRLKEEAQAYTGIDLGDEEITSEDELIDRMQEEMAARREQAELRDRRSRKTATERGKEDHARLAREALREIYRKLASAVHPDREADPQRRAEKTELMQRINQAYATNDLLTLFEAQIRLQQLNPEDVADISSERMKRYNKLLSEQLADLRTRIRDLARRFYHDHGLPPEDRVSPKTLEMLLRQQARDLRGEIARQKQFLDVLATKSSTKRWLKMQRQARALFDDL